MPLSRALSNHVNAFTYFIISAKLVIALCRPESLNLFKASKMIITLWANAYISQRYYVLLDWTTNYINYNTHMRKLLNQEQENWLYGNYAHKTNKELASELSHMIKDENEKTAKKLKEVLKDITDAAVKKSIQKYIAWLAMFNGISEDYIRKYARKLNCPAKSASVRLESSRRRAIKTNIKLWKAKAVRVHAPMFWFSSFILHEKRICFVKDEKELSSIRTAMSRWNRQEGFEKGIFLTSIYVPGAKLLRIEATANRATESI